MQALRSRLHALPSAGRLAAVAVAAVGTAFMSSSLMEVPQTSALSPSEFRSVKLGNVEQLSHNTAVYRFLLPSPQAVVGLPTASFLLVRAPIGDEGKPVVRPYTPISAPDARGHFDLLVKARRARQVCAVILQCTDVPHGRHEQALRQAAGGRRTRRQGTCDEGEPGWRRPRRLCSDLAPQLAYKANMKAAIGMVAGGTGITPMLQVIEEALRLDGDTTRLSLVYANVSPADILLKSRLDALAAAHPRFTVHYTIDREVPAGWQGGVGHVTAAMLRDQLPPAKLGEEALVLVCGPPGFMAAVSGGKAPDYSQGELAGHLKALGYSAAQVLKV